MNRAKVILPKDYFEGLGGPVFCGIALIQRLKAAGIPAVGAIALQGVEKGTLTMTTNWKQELVYTWEYNEDDEL